MLCQNSFYNSIRAIIYGLDHFTIEDAEYRGRRQGGALDRSRAVLAHDPADGPGDGLQGKDFHRGAEIDRRFWHAENHRGGLILGNDVPSCLPQSEKSTCPVAAHSGQQNPDSLRWPVFFGARKEHIHGGAERLLRRFLLIWNW